MRNEAAQAEQPALVESDGRLVVVIPMRFKRRNGRKEILLSNVGSAPPAAGASVADNPAVQKQLVIAVARAHRWQALLDQGRFKTITDLAAAVKLDTGYVRRILGLSLLRPDMVRAILDGTEPDGLSLNRLIAGVPVRWEEEG
jgi:hypothetical protein